MGVDVTNEEMACMLEHSGWVAMPLAQFRTEMRVAWDDGFYATDDTVNPWERG